MDRAGSSFMRGWNLTARYSLRPGHVVFAAVFLLRLIVLVRLTGSHFLVPDQGDMQFYNSWALRILRGEWTDHHAFYGLPLYAYLLAAIYKLFGYTPFLPGLIQAGLDAGTAVLIYKLAGKVFSEAKGETHGQPIKIGSEAVRYRGEFVGIAAAAGWALFQPAEAYCIILMPAAWLTFVFWFVVWQIVRRSQSPGYIGLFLLGGLVGFSAMGIATILFLIPLLLGALFLKWTSRGRDQFKWMERLLGTIVLLAGVFVGTSPSWMHNYILAKDSVVLSAHGGVNLWIGNNPLANGYPKFPPGLRASQEGMLKDSITQAESVAGHPLKRSEVSAYWSSKAAEYIRTHPRDWLELIGRKTRNFWNAFQYDDLSIVTTLRDQNVILLGLGFGVVAALAIPGLLLAWSRFPLSRWIAGAILLQMLSLLSVFVTERYRLAAVPGLLLFASYGVWEFWWGLVRTHYLRVGAYAGSLAVSAWLVSLPEPDSSLWALDNYNTGLQALDSQEFELAQKRLERAYCYVPENAEINFALGNLRFAQGNPRAANAYYLATVRLNPHHEGAYNNLGVVALQSGKWQLAETYLAKAIEQDPSDAKACYLIAQAHLEIGDIRKARLAIAEAIKLDPSRPEFTALRDKIEQVNRR